MSGLLYLSRADVAALLPEVTEQLDLVEHTYRSLAAGRVELPPKPGDNRLKVVVEPVVVAR